MPGSVYFIRWRCQGKLSAPFGPVLGSAQRERMDPQFCGSKCGDTLHSLVKGQGSASGSSLTDCTYGVCADVCVLRFIGASGGKPESPAASNPNVSIRERSSGSQTRF